MADFTEKIRLKGKVEEDLYFSALNRKLIQALHKKQAKKVTHDDEHSEKMDDQNNVGKKN